jgi:hypothetical protein
MTLENFPLRSLTKIFFFIIQNEEKTIVYVLVNKPEAPEQLAEIPQPAPQVPTKPEVYFIKYKTKQEADGIVSGIQCEFLFFF